MSIRIMSHIWENGPTNQSERFVLLALADYANDQGECWPSIAGICQKTCLSERGVQNVLRRLQSSGWLEIESGGGRKNCNLYVIKTPQMDAKTPHQMHPAPDAPPQMDAKTPQMDVINPAPDAPEPSITINEPSVREDAREIRAILCRSASEAAVTSFIAYRRKQKGKALSVTAATRLAKQLDQIFANGGDTDDALGMAEERGWLTVQPDWYFKAKGQTHERNHRREQFTQGRPHGPDAATQQIARLSGLIPPSGYGGS